jgi:DnaJ family protein A protein 2
LDGRGIAIKISKPKGKVLRPGEVLKISGEGMTMKKSDAKGDLYLVIKVEFPEDGWIHDDETIEAIHSILPGPAPPISAEVVDEREFEVSNLDNFGGDEEDDNDGGEWEDEDAEGVPQCAQQ